MSNWRREALGDHSGHSASIFARIKAIQKTLASRRLMTKFSVEGYRDNIVAYARDILRVRLTPDQEAVCEALPRAGRVLMPSGNETGKSFVLSVIALHHYDCYAPGLTIVTAPTERQLGDIVFKEMRTMAPGRPGWRPRANHLEDAPNHWVKGYTARNATAFHGRHEGHVLVMFDEGEEIPKEFWDAAESMATWFIVAYNPILTASPAAIAERNSRWVIRRMDAMKHPNVLADLEGRERPIPGPAALNSKKVLTRLQAWATPVLEGEPQHPDDCIFGTTRWRLGPVAQARLRGIRPTNSTNSVFSDALWNKMLEVKCEVEDHWPLQIGCDIARFGDDYSAIVVRRGKCALHIEKHNGWDNPAIVDRLQKLCVHYANKREDPQNVPVLIDETGGYGASIFDYRDGYRFIPVNVGWKAQKDHGADAFVDARTELWFNFADLVDHGLVDVSRLAPETLNELHDELILPGYDFDKRLRRIMTPKSVTKSALGRSPDLADAFVLAFAICPTYFESYSLLG